MTQITVARYDEGIDEFTIVVPGNPKEYWIPAGLLPYFTGEYGEPFDFVGQVYDVCMPSAL